MVLERNEKRIAGILNVALPRSKWGTFDINFGEVSDLRELTLAELN